LNVLAESIRVSLSGVTFAAWKHNREGAILKLHEEVSEIFRAHRKGEFSALCDKSEAMIEHGIPVLTCGEEEIADVFIVLLGFAHAEGIDLGRSVGAKMAYNTRQR
jgi:NTP pyrophosphatase (non-canonical NTP hydrolase)